MPFSEALAQKANKVLDACRSHSKKLATVESCTGGLLSAILTELPGSSVMFTHGFVTYSNEAKHEMVGVELRTLGQHGAVSEPVAREMAEGALHRTRADIALSITGIAGPSGGSEQKPVGSVHFACACKGKATVHAYRQFNGDRRAIRMAAVDHALDMILAGLQQ